MGDKTGVLRTLERSHNTAKLTAEENPRSEILAEHSEATRIAVDRVAELLAAAEDVERRAGPEREPRLRAAIRAMRED